MCLPEEKAPSSLKLRCLSKKIPPGFGGMGKGPVRTAECSDLVPVQ